MILEKWVGGDDIEEKRQLSRLIECSVMVPAWIDSFDCIVASINFSSYVVLSPTIPFIRKRCLLIRGNLV